MKDRLKGTRREMNRGLLQGDRAHSGRHGIGGAKSQRKNRLGSGQRRRPSLRQDRLGLIQGRGEGACVAAEREAQGRKG